MIESKVGGREAVHSDITLHMPLQKKAMGASDQRDPDIDPVRASALDTVQGRLNPEDRRSARGGWGRSCFTQAASDGDKTHRNNIKSLEEVHDRSLHVDHSVATCHSRDRSTLNVNASQVQDIQT